MHAVIRTVAVPDPTEGQHTLVVTFTVDDELLFDPAARHRIAAHAAALTRTAVAELDIRTDLEEAS